MEKVHEKLSRIPLLAGKSPDELGLQRLGGLTNQNYKLTVDGKNYVLRIPGEGTGEFIDRKSEEHNAAIASAAGVNAEILFFDATDGLQLCRFIDGAETMNADTLKDLGKVARAARALRDIHTFDGRFASRFDVFAMMDDYLDILAKKNATLPEGFAEVQKEAEAVREALDLRPVELVPCHCDPLAENFLDTGERMYLVDWEYAGNNDPMWDLGDLAIEVEFTPEQDSALMEAYFDGPAPASQVGRMVIYKAMCDLLWSAWGVIQVVNDNTVEDFWAYATMRFERCKRIMAQPDFPAHIQAIREG